MAYEVTYWEMEGKNDIEIRRTRIAKLEDIERDNLVFSMPTRTDLITIERSDKQSPYYREIWKSERYIDLNER